MMDKSFQNFLGNALFNQERLDRLPPLTVRGLADWIAHLERYLGLIAVPVTSANTKLQGYALWIGNHKEHGPLLLKHIPTLFGEDRVRCLALETSETFDLSEDDTDALADLRVLFEPYPISKPITFRNITDYILKTARGIMRQALFVQGMATMAGSIFFIVNFNVLAYVVPAQSHDAYWATAWLVAGLVAIITLTYFLAQRVQFTLDSATEERSELLKLSLLWSVRPQFVAEHGADRAHELCGIVAQAGRTMTEALMAIIASLAILPVLILMYLRLPGFLFVATILIAIAGAGLQVFLQRRQHRQQRQLSSQEREASSFLYRMLCNTSRLNFYGVTRKEIARWRERQTVNADEQHRLVEDKSFGREMDSSLMDVTQLLAIFALSVLVSISMENGEVLTVGMAFIMLHLVTTTYRMIPRVAQAVGKIGTIRIDLAEASHLFDEVSYIRELDEPSVTQADASVDCYRLRLPHGCRFMGQEHLTLRLDGPQVVRIAGESGAGKTTFLTCLLGLQSPEAGSIKVFGVDPTQLSMGERRRIFAYADQNVQLLPGTVRDNLKLFGAHTASDRTLWEALERVMLLDRVQNLPLGLDTPISDAKRNFSTGERQRMALAQCIAKKSAILVLDEAMSGLPKEMEQAVFANIRPLFEQIYFVSHRQHMHELADVTIELDVRR